MSPLAETLLVTLAELLTAMLALWLLSLWLRDASIVDPFWGSGFILVTWTAWAWNRHDSPRAWLLAVLTTVWGARLTLYLLWRRRGHAEDRRYRAMRAAHGPRFWWISLLTVFVLQGVILWFVSWPVQVAMLEASPRDFGPLDAFGVALWCVGLFFETVGDWQLARFQANPANAGHVLDHGLWRYTRHPNYFGDFCVWWGLYAVAAGGGAWWTVLSPWLMSVLLLKVSGVTLLEKTIHDRRRDYADYQSRTSAFFPRPPKPAR